VVERSGKAECRESGTLRLAWEVGVVMLKHDPYHLNQAGKAIGHTSVYQNLEALSSQGIIECIERSDGRLYGNISDSHSHVNCINTGQLLDIYVQLPQELIDHVEKQTGVRITDYRIDFYGYRLSTSESSTIPASNSDSRPASPSEGMSSSEL
jgi:Fur family ferric uptake transcriptional regulator